MGEEVCNGEGNWIKNLAVERTSGVSRISLRKTCGDWFRVFERVRNLMTSN